MKIFITWIKEGGEHKTVFENCSAMKMGKSYLQGSWNVARKIRLARFIRKMIEEGTIVSGMKELCEESCRILRDMVGRRGTDEEEEEDEEVEEQEHYISELCLLKLIAEKKKVKEDELELLKQTLEEEKQKREEAERGRNEAEGRNGELEQQVKTLMEEIDQLKNPAQTPLHPSSVSTHNFRPITSLDKISLKFSDSDDIKREGNIIIHASNSWERRHCFIGGEMSSVCLCYNGIMLTLFIFYRESIGCMMYYLCVDYL